MRIHPSAPFLNKPPQLSQNIITKNKKPAQSDFRVHFTLMNVKWKNKQQSKLIQHVINVVNGLCRTHIAQVSAVLQDDTFDISIGLYNDMEAFQFLRRKPSVTLSDGNKQHSYQPRVSRVFQSYINKMQKIQQKQPKVQNQLPVFYTGKASQSNRSRLKEKNIDIQQIQYRGYGMELAQNKTTNQLNQVKEKQSKLRYSQSISNDKQINKILIFGIPKQFQISDVKKSLSNYGITNGQCKWRLKDYMEYLEVDLIKPISKANIYYLSLQIEGFPVVALPIMEQGQIMAQLSRFTVQIIVKGMNDDEAKIIEIMNDIGGVNIMLRTPMRQGEEYRYVIVFNNVQNAEKACRVAKDFRECTAQRKQYQQKIGRINKYFTFTSLVSQLNYQRK